MYKSIYTYIYIYIYGCVDTHACVLFVFRAFVFFRHRGYGGGRSHTRKIKKLRTGMEEAEATLEASQQAEFSEGRSMVSLEATELMEGASGSDEWKPRTDECQLYYVTCRSQ